MNAYKDINKKKLSCLNETERKCKKNFSLPIYPGLKDSEINKIIKNLKEIIKKI